jgi:hypothetical protein
MHGGEKPPRPAKEYPPPQNRLLPRFINKATIVIHDPHTGRTNINHKTHTDTESRMLRPQHNIASLTRHTLWTPRRGEGAPHQLGGDER